MLNNRRNPDNRSDVGGCVRKKLSRSYKFHRHADLFPMMDEVAFGALADDIQKRGLLHPIVLFQGRILDGRNRYRACLKAGIEPRFTTFKGREPLAFAVSANVQRRHMTESQRAMVAQQLLPRLEIEAKQRQGSRTDLGPKHSGKIAGKSRRGDSRSHAARLLGINARYVSDAKKIAAEAPDVAAEVRAGTLTIPEAKLLSPLTKRERLSIIRRRLVDPKLNVRLAVQAVNKKRVLKNVTDLATVQGRFQVLLCDPPWFEPTCSSSRAIENHYPVMSLDQLKALNVQSVSANDSVLFLWATAPGLKDALNLMEHWGFQYVSQLVWVKGPQWGKGHWFRHKHELLLLGKRGKLPAPVNKPCSVLEAEQPPVRIHSQKPQEVYVLIESMYPDLKIQRLELFARGKPRPNWGQWGAEANGTRPSRLAQGRKARTLTVPESRPREAKAA